jgi:predicted secreted hydrolase
MTRANAVLGGRLWRLTASLVLVAVVVFSRRRLRLAAVLALVAVVVGCTPSARPLPEVPRPSPTPAPPVVFPRDAQPHDALTEWWYYTGHLTSAAGDTYGFEFVVFQVARAGQPTGYLSHFAISDIGAQRFSHQARFAQSPSPSEAFPLDVGGWSLDHQDRSDRIQADMQRGAGAEAPYALQLELDDTPKPPALHNGGYIFYPPVGGSYYYSRTRLTAAGLLTTPDGSVDAVSGVAWMDHQWGNFVLSTRGGWDWYSLQLDDSTELMLYVIRDPAGVTTAVYGTVVGADGQVSALAPGSVLAEATGQWRSPHTGADYPSGWLVTLPDARRLVLTPQLEDQELYFPAVPTSQLSYWEGAVTISGDTTGVGYVELTGYAH